MPPKRKRAAAGEAAVKKAVKKVGPLIEMAHSIRLRISLSLSYLTIHYSIKQTNTESTRKGRGRSF